MTYLGLWVFNSLYLAPLALRVAIYVEFLFV